MHGYVNLCLWQISYHVIYNLSCYVFWFHAIKIISLLRNKNKILTMKVFWKIIFEEYFKHEVNVCLFSIVTRCVHQSFASLPRSCTRTSVVMATWVWIPSTTTGPWHSPYPRFSSASRVYSRIPILTYAWNQLLGVSIATIGLSLDAWLACGRGNTRCMTILCRVMCLY